MSPRPTTSLASLVRTARSPNVPLREQHAAFTRIVEQSQHIVLGRALASLRDAAEAKDAAQEAFITAWLRLRRLRDPDAFPAWLMKIVTTQCNRRARRRTRESKLTDLPEPHEARVTCAQYHPLLAKAITSLPKRERDTTVLFYFLGHTQKEIARLLRLKPGTVGKRLHSARLKIRRVLPSSVRRDFVRPSPSRSFLDRVRLGLFDEYVGEYRFERRPGHVVSILRENDCLVGVANKQRNVLASLADDSLVAGEFDGEARFRRDRRGRISSFVYYEFGKRLGVAHRLPPTNGEKRTKV